MLMSIVCTGRSFSVVASRRSRHFESGELRAGYSAFRYRTQDCCVRSTTSCCTRSKFSTIRVTRYPRIGFLRRIRRSVFCSVARLVDTRVPPSAPCQMPASRTLTMVPRNASCPPVEAHVPSAAAKAMSPSHYVLRARPQQYHRLRLWPEKRMLVTRISYHTGTTTTARCASVSMVPNACCCVTCVMLDFTWIA
eukprot:Rmarinus@m.11958